MVLHMKKTQKGVTLIEVIVAIAVFAVISLALFSSVIAMQNVIARQEEYVKLEMVCYDINAYKSKYPSNWSYEYFNGEVNERGYLKRDFTPTNNEAEAFYIIEFDSDQIKSISNLNGVILVENVKLPINQGGNR